MRDALIPSWRRVRGEYCEMPGLQLTVDRACRLWQVDVATCEMVLEQLVLDRFLRKTHQGAYVSVPQTRQPDNVDR